MPADPASRYARHLSLPQIGAAGQQRLADSHALVIGLGGLGSIASLYLSSSGVGRLTVNDYDRIDPTNLPRQILFDEHDIDAFKTAVTARRLRDVNPAVRIDVLDGRLPPDALRAAAAASDIVLDCTDNFASRGAINRACLAARRPLVTGAAIRFEGQLAVFRHDRQPTPCYSCLYTEQDENLENCAGQGILAPVVGTIGCMMATEAVKLLAGLESALDGKLWAWDALAGAGRTIGIKSRPDCPVCGPTA